ncbi:ComF family protein [Halomonadaceae bacterium KBTZ08]
MKTMIRMAGRLSTKATRLVNSVNTSRLRLSRCVICLGADESHGLCHACLRDLPNTRPCCERCALPLSIGERGASLCQQCVRTDPPQDLSRIPWRYECPVDRMIQNYKYHGARAQGAALARNWLAACGTPETLPQALIPAPLDKRRLRERGFSQTGELADWFSRATGIPLLADRLRRHPGYQAQANLSRSDRRRNLQGAFFIAGARALPEHVALVEDVVTTGATAEAMGHCLRKAGVRRLEVWALARTP